jgi:glutathione S-transferase
MLWSGDYLSSSWEAWMAPVIRPDHPVDGVAREKAYEDIAAHLDVLERRLTGRDWLVDAYSLADVCYAPFVTVFEHVGFGELMQARPAVSAWVERLRGRPAVRETAPPPVPLSLPPRK